MAEPLKAEEIAHFAAQGVAIALSARARSELREATPEAHFDPFRPVHIIIGLIAPETNPQLYDVELVPEGDSIRIGAIQPHKSAA